MKKSVTLQKHIVCRSPIWACGRDADIYKSVYLAHILAIQNLANSISLSQECGNVNVLWYDMPKFLVCALRKMLENIIQRETSALLFLLRRAMREP